MNPHSAPIRKIQPVHRVCSFGLLLFSGLTAWATPGALAQSSSQDTTREDVRPKTEDTGRPSTNARKEIAPATNETAENKLGLQLFKNIARDQRDIWTSPAHVRLGNADWLVPFAGVTAGLMVTDRDTSLHLSNDPSKLRNYRKLSNYGAAGMAGAVGGLYLWGRATNDPHKQEAGILSGEAALDALLVSTALKYATGRERPRADSYHGKFWQGGDSRTVEISSARTLAAEKRDGFGPTCLLAADATPGPELEVGADRKD